VNAVTYYRVSTKAQGRSGLGLEAQRSTVESYLQVKDAHLLDEVVEIESGGKNDRPQLERALRRCRLAKATLVVAKLDRLSRDVEFIHRLQREGVDFVCADMPEANTLTIGLLRQYRQLCGEACAHCYCYRTKCRTFCSDSRDRRRARQTDDATGSGRRFERSRVQDRTG